MFHEMPTMEVCDGCEREFDTNEETRWLGYPDNEDWVLCDTCIDEREDMAISALENHLENQREYEAE